MASKALLVSTLIDHVEKCIEDVGEKIKSLLSSQYGVQEQVESFLKLLQDSSVPSMGVTPVSAQVCATIVDELAERERRKRNVVIYNLPEAKGREADRFSALSQIKTVYSLETQKIARVIHLGRKIKDKHSVI